MSDREKTVGGGSAHGVEDFRLNGDKRVLRLFFGAAILVASADRGWCLDPGLSLTQYIHTSWTQSDGAVIPNVWSLAQTRDGFLWMGTADGLIHFDGLRFVRWKPPENEELPGNNITSLAASADGSLWIGAQGGISRLRQGHLRSYRPAHRAPAAALVPMVEDRQGRLWAGNAQPGTGGLVLIENAGMKAISGGQDDLPKSQVLSLFVDRDDCLWIGTAQGLCRWNGRKGEQCSLTNPGSAIKSMARDSDGRFIAGTTRGLLRLGNDPTGPVEHLLKNKVKAVSALLRDRDGNLWVGTMGQGLFCVRPGRVEQFTRLGGLSGDMVNALFEDHEGNIWVGTGNGIDRLRDPKVARWSTLEGLSGNLVTAVYGARNGEMWVAALGSGINQLSGNPVTRYSVYAGSKGITAMALYEDARGALWAGTPGGVGYFSNGRFAEVSSSDGKSLKRVFAITGDAERTLWLADAQQGLVRLRNGRIEPAKAAIVPGKTIYQLQADREGNLWIGYHEGGLTVAGNGSVRAYDRGSGLAGGPVQAIYEDSFGAIWVGTGEGLSRFRNGRWTTWTAAHGLPAGGVQGVIQDDRSHLWLVTAAGVAPLDFAGLDAYPDGMPRRLQLSVYGPNDGIRWTARGKMVNPRIAKSRDGRLWISTEDGVASIDPARMRVNQIPPPVAIEQILVDGVPLDTTKSEEIGLRGHEVELQYTALSLTLPETVRFRYKLEGFDQNWIDAGARRQIVYANLPPRHYRFHVLACNNDQVWNEAGATLAFRQDPYFYQTWLFYCLCAAAAGLSGMGVHKLRLRQIRSRFQLVLDERSRLTRELHDTLLQGFAGVVYQLEAGSRQLLTWPEAGRRRIERALEQADQSMREARETLSSLRLSELENCELPEALEAAGKKIVDASPIRFEMAVKGRGRQLPYDLQVQLFIIAREAMNNAVNHANPSRIWLELSYLPDRMHLSVRDDGAGFDVQAQSHKEGHWGLSGMRERACLIGAVLTVESSPGQGTTVAVLTAPSSPRRPKRKQ